MSPRITNYGGPFLAVSFATFICYGSFVCAVILGIIMKFEKQTEEGEPLMSRRDSNDSTTSTQSKLPTSFWILALVLVTLYGTVIPFNTTASDFLMSKWYPGDIEMAGFVMRYF
jgi:hypothetical protein